MKTIVDAYDIYVPFDLGDDQERLRVAILEAEERARLWVNPCRWTAQDQGNGWIKVRRYRRQSGKRGGA